MKESLEDKVKEISENRSAMLAKPFTLSLPQEEAEDVEKIKSIYFSILDLAESKLRQFTDSIPEQKNLFPKENDLKVLFPEVCSIISEFDKYRNDLMTLSFKATLRHSSLLDLKDKASATVEEESVCCAAAEKVGDREATDLFTERKARANKYMEEIEQLLLDLNAVSQASQTFSGILAPTFVQRLSEASDFANKCNRANPATVFRICGETSHQIFTLKRNQMQILSHRESHDA